MRLPGMLFGVTLSFRVVGAVILMLQPAIDFH